jgi:hypothetical protein
MSIGSWHDDRWRPGGLRSLAAAVRRHPHRFTAPTERTPSRESANKAHSFVARMVAGSEGCFGLGRDRSRTARQGPLP